MLIPFLYMEPSVNIKKKSLIYCFQLCAVEHAKTLLDALARLSEQQLLQFDGLLVIDDVEKGRMLSTVSLISEMPLSWDHSEN